jgi:sugar phosphate isomerase/epimerase
MTERFTRRRFLKTSSLAAAACVVPGAGERLAGAAETPYGPFKMGIQSYSLRGYDVDAALEWTRKLGLHYWEAYPRHLPETDDDAQLSGYRSKLGAAGVTLMAYGVVRFGADTTANRALFQFAKKAGIATLSADPEPGAFDQLDRLVDEFGVNVAIHNHGPGARYDKIKDVVHAVEGRHPRIGACVDTGHFLRSQEDPVEAIHRLGKRVHGVHLKDVRGATEFTVLGKGDLDVLGVLKTLEPLGFSECLALEYEENPEDPIADIRQCLEVVREAAARL